MMFLSLHNTANWKGVQEKYKYIIEVKIWESKPEN